MVILNWTTAPSGPLFYEAHKADLDLLWEKAKAVLFAVEGEVGIADATLIGSGDDELADPDEALGMAEDEADAKS